jgi:hypothetical protein
VDNLGKQSNGTSAIRSLYQATTGEDSRMSTVRVVVNYRVRESAIVL